MPLPKRGMKQGRVGYRGGAVVRSALERPDRMLVDASYLKLSSGCMWVVFITLYAFISLIYFKIILTTTKID